MRARNLPVSSFGLSSCEKCKPAAKDVNLSSEKERREIIDTPGLICDDDGVGLVVEKIIDPRL